MEISPHYLDESESNQLKEIEEKAHASPDVLHFVVIKNCRAKHATSCRESNIVVVRCTSTDEESCAAIKECQEMDFRDEVVATNACTDDASPCMQYFGVGSYCKRLDQPACPKVGHIPWKTLLTETIRAMFDQVPIDRPSSCENIEVTEATRSMTDCLLDFQQAKKIVVRLSSKKNASRYEDLLKLCCKKLGFSSRFRIIRFAIPDKGPWQHKLGSDIVVRNLSDALKLDNVQGVPSLIILGGRSMHRGTSGSEVADITSLAYYDMRSLSPTTSPQDQVAELQTLSGYGEVQPTVLAPWKPMSSFPACKVCISSHGHQLFELATPTHLGSVPICQQLCHAIKKTIQKEDMILCDEEEADVVSSDEDVPADETQDQRKNLGEYPEFNFVQKQKFIPSKREEGRYIQEGAEANHVGKAGVRRHLVARFVARPKYGLQPWSPTEYTQKEQKAPTIATVVVNDGDEDKQFKFTVPASQQQHFRFSGNKKEVLQIRPKCGDEPHLKYAIFQFSYNRSGGPAVPNPNHPGDHGWGNLDLREAMQTYDGNAATYCQVVVVQEQQHDQYVADWPRITVCSLPRDANSSFEKGKAVRIGVARHYAKLLATRLCANDDEGNQLAFFIDDSTTGWVHSLLVNDPYIPPYTPSGKQPVAHRSVNFQISAFTVLQHVANDPERHKYACIGFLKMNPYYHSKLKHAYARRDVGCWTFVNLRLTSGITYKKNENIYEDFNWNKECTEADHVIVKYYRFGLQKQPSLPGGCHALKDNRPHFRPVRTRQRLKHKPQNRRTVGLENPLGANICYLNALLHLMRNITAIRTAMGQRTKEFDEDNSGDTAAQRVVKAISRTFRNLAWAERNESSATPSAEEVVEALDELRANSTGERLHQDVHEFFEVLKDCFEKVDDVRDAIGELRWKYKWVNASNDEQLTRSGEEDSWYLPIRPQHDSVEAAARSFLEWEAIVGSSGPSPTHQSQAFTSLPSNLLAFSVDRTRSFKVQETINIGHVLEMSRIFLGEDKIALRHLEDHKRRHFCAALEQLAPRLDLLQKAARQFQKSTVIGSTAPSDAAWQAAEYAVKLAALVPTVGIKSVPDALGNAAQSNPSHMRYRLTALIMYFGDGDKGHYVSYTKQEGGKWAQQNDRKTRTYASFDEIKLHGIIKALLYERIDSNSEGQDAGQPMQE